MYLSENNLPGTKSLRTAYVLFGISRSFLKFFIVEYVHGAEQWMRIHQSLIVNRLKIATHLFAVTEISPAGLLKLFAEVNMKSRDKRARNTAGMN